MYCEALRWANRTPGSSLSPLSDLLFYPFPHTNIKQPPFLFVILTAYSNSNNLKYCLFSVCQMALSILYYLVLCGYCFNKSLLSLLSA